MKSFLLTAGVVISLQLAAQTQLDTIITHFRSTQLAKLDTLLDLSKSKADLSWLNLLPNISYDVNRSSLNIGVSLSNFSSYYQQKKRNKIELIKVQLNIHEQLNNKVIGLKNEYLQLQSEYLKSKNEVEALYKHLPHYFLKHQQFQNHDINLEKWMLIKLKFQQSIELSQVGVMQLKIKTQKLQNKLGITSDLPIQIKLKSLQTKINNLKQISIL